MQWTKGLTEACSAIHVARRTNKCAVKVIVLALLFTPMVALAGGGEPDPAIGPRTVCAAATTCAPQRQATLPFARSAPFDSDAAGRSMGRSVAQFLQADPAVRMSPPLHTQGHAPDANRGSNRTQYLARAPLVLNLAATGEDESGAGTGDGSFASRVHLLWKGHGAQPVSHGIAYTVSGREYIAIARWHRAPALVLVFALP